MVSKGKDTETDQAAHIDARLQKKQSFGALLLVPPSSLTVAQALVGSPCARSVLRGARTPRATAAAKYSRSIREQRFSP